MYIFKPALAEQGKKPFTLDSKEANADYKEFLLGENRYAQLAKAKPQVAEKLFAINEKEAKERYAGFKKLSDLFRRSTQKVKQTLPFFLFI